MNKRDNLLSTLRRQGWKALPCDMELTPYQKGEFKKRHPFRTMAGYFGLSHRMGGCLYSPTYKGDGKQLFQGKTIPESFRVDPFGVGESKGSKAAMHMVHFHSPLEGEETTLDQIQKHPLPRFIKGLKPLLKFYSAFTHLRGLAMVGFMEQTIWERSWLIRGMNDLMMEMMTDDPRATILLDKITDHSCISAALLAQTNHDIIALGDDVGMQSTLMISPELWRKWLKPRLSRVIKTIKTINPHILIFYHSCGFIEPIIGDLVEIGVEILNPIQPESMDFKKIHDEFGDELSFWGGIGTQTTFPFGTPADVKEKIKEIVDICGEKGGLVIAPTHIVEPEVPWENIQTFRNEVLKYKK